MRFIVKFFMSLLLSLGLANASEYILDSSHTSVEFSVKHLMITNVKGEFKNFDSDIDFDAKSKTFESFSATVETKSIDTDNAKRDKHLISEDFFFSKKYPEMTFVMKSYKSDGDEGKMTGDLTIRGVTKIVIFDVEDIGTIKDFKGNNRVGFTIKGKINRTDYGLKWNRALEAGGLTVGEKVKITIEVQAMEF